MREIYELSSKLRSAVQDEERSRKVAGKLGMAVSVVHTEVKVKGLDL
jgi:hypothetical protein